MVNTEDEDGIKKHEEGKASISLKLAKYLSSSGLGDITDLINVFLCLLFTIVHCIDTYYWSSGTFSVPDEVYFLKILELSCDLFFLIDLILNFYIAENKLFFAFSTM